MQNTSPDYASVLVTKRRADKARTTEAPAKRAVGHAEEADRTRPAGRATQSGRMIAAMQVRIDA